ncbi:MAG: zf-HC2 domain-containing protein [Lachnospira sp.]
MDKCKEFQNLIEKFDKDELSLKQEENFVKHINSCNDCREELEIYYIFSYGLLEEDNDDYISRSPYKIYFESYDFTGLVDKKLKDSENKCRMIHKWIRANYIRFVYTNICLVAAAIIFFMTMFK